MVGKQIAGDGAQRCDERHCASRFGVGEGQGVGVQDVVIRRFERG